MDINSLLDSIAANPSRNFKIDELKAHAENETLREVIRLALDPYTQFYIRKIPEYQDNGRHETLQSLLPRLDILSNRVATGNAGISHLQLVLSSAAPEDAKVIERIIQKDLRCGVSESTANKVWPGLVHEYPVMLASPFETKLIDKIEWTAYVQLKLDGMRFNAVVRGGKVEFRSRNGKLIDIPYASFAQPFIEMARHYQCNMVFDGELVVMDEHEYQYLDRKTGNGILNKAVKGTMSEEEAKGIRGALWDAIPLEDFEKGIFKEEYHVRLAKLTNAVSHTNNATDAKGFVHVVWKKIVGSLEEAQVIFNQMLAEGEEGIILKDKNGIWEDKRAKHQIKFKGEFECDLLCVGWEEGTGKNVGKLGALQLESSCGKLKVGVGSGLTDADRANIGQEVIGKIIAIKYNAIVDDKRLDTKSLFLPIFLEVREDKTVADTLESLKG